jgi:hypothetical protein
MPQTARRALVISGVFASLVIGVVTIHNAAGWAATASILENQPTGVSDLEAALSASQSRSAALQEQFREMTIESTDLARALQAAAATAGSDAAVAGEVGAGLADAQHVLATAAVPDPTAPPRLATQTVKPAPARTTAPIVQSATSRHDETRERHEEEDDD